MYPTTKEVQDAVQQTNVDGYIPTVKNWKKQYYNKKWSALSTEHKKEALANLIYQIATLDKQIILVAFGTEYSYNKLNKLITIGHNASIVSTLHEIGHALWGDKEIDACRYSVAIFMQVFPKEFKQLTWDGHMLKRKNVNY
jgi:hypothetical protein